jgi:hypothetical protein
LAAVFFFDVDAHEAELKHLLEEIFAEVGFFVHGADVRGEAFFGELADGGLEEAFFLLKDGKRRGGGQFDSVSHDKSIIAFVFVDELRIIKRGRHMQLELGEIGARGNTRNNPNRPGTHSLD